MAFITRGIISRLSQLHLRPRGTFPAIATALAVAVTAGALAAARSDSLWMDNLGGPDSSHYSRLDQINKSNVTKLQVAWFYPHGNTGFNPIVVDDMMFVSGRNNSLIALDPTTGKEIWIHENIPDLSARGINYWQSKDGKDRAPDLHRPACSCRRSMRGPASRSRRSASNGFVDLREGLPRGEGRLSRAESRQGLREPDHPRQRAPAKAGCRRLEISAPTTWSRASACGSSTPCRCRASSATRRGRRTPTSTSAARTPGARCRSTRRAASSICRPARAPTTSTAAIARAPTSSPTACSRSTRAPASGSGTSRTLHHDLWDFDNVSAPQLVTVTHNGRNVDAVAQAGKTGFLYVFNRVTGEPLWPIEERPVPQTDIPGEKSWPTQPIPTVVPPFGRQKFTVDDINPWLLTPAEQARHEGARRQDAQRRASSRRRRCVKRCRCRATRAARTGARPRPIPRRALVYVLNIDAVAILKLDNTLTKVGGFQGGGRGGPGGAGATLFQQHCQVCHGANLQNPIAGVPSLVGVTERLSEDVVRATVTGGKGMMRPIPGLNAADLTALLAYLANPAGGRGGFGGRGGPAAAPSLLVRSSRPAACRRRRSHRRSARRPSGPRYPGNGGNGGNARLSARCRRAARALCQRMGRDGERHQAARTRRWSRTT